MAATEHVVDHALKAKLLAVVRRVNARYTIVVQFFNLGGNDHATASTKNLDMTGA